MSIKVHTRIDEHWLAVASDILEEIEFPARSNSELVRFVFTAGLMQLDPNFQNRQPSTKALARISGGQATRTQANPMQNWLTRLGSHNQGNSPSPINQPITSKAAEPRWHLLEDSTFKRRAQTLYQHHLAGTTDLEEDSSSEREDLAQVAVWLLGELRSQGEDQV